MFWGLLVASRIFLLARYPHFFDAPEYLRLANSNSLLEMFTVAHNPVHPIYLLLLRLAHSPLQVSLISAVFGILGIGAFYLLVKNIFSKTVANRALLPLIFFPHLFLIQTNILHESVEQAFLLGALLMLTLFLRHSRVLFFALMLGLYLLALMTFIGILIWTPLFLILVFYLSAKEQLWKNLFLVGLGLVLTIGLSLFFYSQILSKGQFQSFLEYLFINPLGGFSVWEIGRTLRNCLLILFTGFSPAAFLALIVGGFYCLKNRRWFLLLTALVIGGIFYLTGKYWYGGLYGRYSAFIAFPLALIFAKTLSQKEYLLSLGILVVFFGSTVTQYLQKPLPQIQATIIRSLPNWQQQYLVISDYQRPQLEYEGINSQKTLIVTDNQTTNQKLEHKIKAILEAGQPVYLTAQAVHFPYYQYDGQALHIIGQNRQGQPKLATFLNSKNLKLAIINYQQPYLNLYRLELFND